MELHACQWLHLRGTPVASNRKRKRSRRSGDQDEELVILPKTVRSSQEETTNFREGAVRRIVLHNFL